MLLQIYIAKEETKFGLDEQELDSALIAYNSNKPRFSNIRICGVMGMATNTDNVEQVYGEYKKLHTIFERIAATWFNDAAHFSICSMGMSADYKIALQAGSNMVRIGSMLFGKRVYTG